MVLTDGLSARSAPPDDAIIARAQAGDADAFGALVAARLGRTVRMAKAMVGSESDALDAVQEAFLSAWVHLRDLRDPSRFDAWLNRIVANRCRETLRRRGRVREIDIADAGLSQPDATEASLNRAAILAAFDRLSIGDRQILVLRHLEDLSVDQVGDRLGIPSGTVKSRLFAAHRALERALEASR
jgi:RNA polymerase sigma-70 factor (ECF subfamily)